jgi:hypothetical protein
MLLFRFQVKERVLFDFSVLFSTLVQTKPNVSSPNVLTKLYEPERGKYKETAY